MKILITGAFRAHKMCAAILANMGHNVVFLQNESDSLPEPADTYDAVVCNDLFRYHKIEGFKNLNCIHLTSAGFDRVDMDYITKNGIKIFNAKGVYSSPMAEFVVGSVLALYKQSRFFANNQKTHSWVKNRELKELYSKTVCVVGCGSVGTECAKRFSAFGTRVLGVDLCEREDENYEKIYSLGQIDDALFECDILVLTLPLTSDTRHIIDSKRLSHLRDDAVIVNVSRGAVVDTMALIEELPRFFGAVLDVFEEEPLSADSPLWDMENVIVTPHNSFVGEHNGERLCNLIVKNFKELGNA